MYVQPLNHVPILCDPMDYSMPGSSVYWIFPGRNTGVGCHFLLQGIFSTQGLKLCLLHLLALAGGFITTSTNSNSEAKQISFSHGPFLSSLSLNHPQNLGQFLTQLVSQWVFGHWVSKHSIQWEYFSTYAITKEKKKKVTRAYLECIWILSL